MKRFLKLGLSLLVAGGVVGTALGVANRPVEVAKAADVVENQRVYVAVKFDWWAEGEERDLYIYHDGDGDIQWENCPKMTNLFGVNVVSGDTGYWKGAYYFDVPTNATKVTIKKTSGTCETWEQTLDINLSSNVFLNNDYKMIYVEERCDSSFNKRTLTYGEFTLSAEQMAILLSSDHLNVCSDSFANGYNAYPQLNDLVFVPSKGGIETGGQTIVKQNSYNGEIEFTLSEVINQLEYQYNIHNTSSSSFFSLKEDDFTMIIVVVSILSVSAIGLIAFVSKKRKRA